MSNDHLKDALHTLAILVSIAVVVLIAHLVYTLALSMGG